VKARRFYALASLAVILALANAPVSARAAATTLGPVFGATAWLNGRATPASLHGKVVLVDVFTFDCSNCRNVVPNLSRLSATKDDGLAIVGIHSPETPTERVRANVVDALRAQGITWPVAIDNGFTVWNAYGVEYWPTELIFDRHGRLRKTVIGDSQDDVVNATIRQLLKET
jgi:thiol-disulfide isomerase/thioredoxin